MTTAWNPFLHLKHAWSKLTTIWGKIALILFYSYIWLTILSCIVALIFPGSRGMECVIGTVTDPWSRVLYVEMLRVFNLFLLGFLLYADVGGLQIKNVAFVALFTVVCVGIMLGSLRNLQNADEIKYKAMDDCFTPYVRASWAAVAWIIVSLVMTVMEEKLGEQGTEEERQPLSV